MKEGWEIKKLAEICEFKSGTTISSNLEKSFGEILYAKVGDMNIGGNEVYITASSRYVSLNDINQNQIIPIGSIIFPKRGGAIATNKKRRIIKPTIVDLNTMALIPNHAIDKDYLFYWFQRIDLAELSNGTSIPQINNYSFNNVYISYPKSHAEQQHIVSILDQAFAAIDQAKANVQKNLNNAKELFQSELNTIFSQKGEGWVEKKLGDLCNEIFAGGDVPKDNFSEVKTEKYNIPIIANAVKDNGLYGYTNLSRVKEPAITIAARGSGTGHTEVRYEPFFPIVRLIVLIPNKSKVTLQFLKFSILNLKILRSGSAIPQLTVPMIKSYSIPLPPIDLQQKIVSKL